MGALLLFALQPVMARLVLPLLGGSAAVWVTCVAYYQVLLLAGYVWAHVVVSRTSLRAQVVLQVALLAASVLLQLPLALRASEPPSAEWPVLWLLGGLTASIGFTFFALATTAPLLQAWLFRTAGTVDPYPLYRASNAGSALALVAYPFVVEPWLTLRWQRYGWSALYLVYVALVTAVAVRVWRGGPREARFGEPAAAEAQSPAAGPVSPQRIARWLFLAAVPSSLMLGVTTFVTSEVASVPLLWILPLLAYLVSFVITFSPSTVVPHRFAVRLLPATLVIVLVAQITALRSPWWLLAALHVMNLLLAALVCHGELARDRPEARRLTLFYLALAAGGAAGGLFNSLLAPWIFNDVFEYPLALVAAGAALPMRRRASEVSEPRRERLFDVEFPIGAGALAVLFIVFTREFQVSKWVGALVTLGLPAAIVFGFRRRPLRFALGLGALVVAAVAAVQANGRVLFADRSFFGVLRVTTDATGRAHSFHHGSTLHGRQDMAPPYRRQPLTYYHRGGPVDDVIRAFPEGVGSVGVAGLGTGTMAAYSRSGERWTFFEIDPMVAGVAQDPALFTFLRDARAAVEVVLGDARLALSETGERRFDLLVLDAFSSDAVPVHLLTVEALDQYLRALQPGGLLVFNVSNRYVDLAPLLGSLGRTRGLTVIARDDRVDVQMRRRGWLSSHWVAMGQGGSARLALLSAMAGWVPVAPGPRPWTDDYASLVSVLRVW